MLLNIEQAIKLLNSNEIIILDTDTIVGISGKLHLADKIRKLKGKPNNAPLSMLISNPNQITLDQQYINSFKHLLDSQTTVITQHPFGIRLTESQELCKIINQTGPIISTSANVHGANFATTVEEAIKIFNLPAFKLATAGSGKPSRIVQINPFKIIRN